MSATARTSPNTPARPPTRPPTPPTTASPPTAAQPLHTTLDRAGLHTPADADHQAVHDLTHHLDPAPPRQAMSRLEQHTRTVTLALRGTGPAPAARPVVHRSRP
ncbi:hypothetical protein ACFYST_15355 [Kitasatospora sp. NPDC004614]|uniref:hypothetical protein n=1 Tax=unclassified Kitasatospora TaxID=2633591 RepID=UPI0036A8FE43